MVFVIRLPDGEEVHGTDADELTINQDTGVLTVTRVDGFETVTTHYSPATWASVTQRVKGASAAIRAGYAPPHRPTVDRGR